jgi:glycosyltransferase involved in cell wall biosynthesis
LPAAHVEAVPLWNSRYDPWRFDRRVVWDQALLPLAALASRAQLLHCTSGSMPRLSPLPIVVTIHDVAWLRTVQRHTPAYARAYFGPFMAGRWKTARAVIVDSAFTRDELLRSVALDPRRISVVNPGVDAAFARLERAPSAETTILCVGTVERRKNAAVVIEALRDLPRARLICAGPPTPYQDECLALAQRLGVDERVDFAGYVPRERLLELYASATLAVAPSRYEGFGYAAAQALCAGVPLVAANSSSLVEVVESDAPLLDPDDVRAWADAIIAMLRAQYAAEDHARAIRQRSIARFSWAKSASATAAVYRSALEIG